ncbi:MAG: hypothetical protein LH468_01830 [Nocardioides sp.]|nr:hypothetical protein [Nocardioides sp.]
MSAYSVVSYPDAATVGTDGAQGPYDDRTPSGVLQNVGYSQARFTIASMLDAGLKTPMVWLDVESVPGFDWSADAHANAAVVTGAARGYTDAGYRVGVYSTPYLWAQIVGDLRLGVPEWRPAGASSRAAAESRCGDDWVIQGGAAVMVQWVEQERDQDVTWSVSLVEVRAQRASKPGPCWRVSVVGWCRGSSLVLLAPPPASVPVGGLETCRVRVGGLRRCPSLRLPCWHEVARPWRAAKES